MSKSILEALYFGKILPCEWERDSSPERKAVEEKIEQEKNYLKEKISSDDWTRLQQLEELYIRAGGFDDVKTFSNGFTFGALLIIEIMGQASDIINEK